VRAAIIIGVIELQHTPHQRFDARQLGHACRFVELMLDPLAPGRGRPEQGRHSANIQSRKRRIKSSGVACQHCRRHTLRRERHYRVIHGTTVQGRRAVGVVVFDKTGGITVITHRRLQLVGRVSGVCKQQDFDHLEIGRNTRTRHLKIGLAVHHDHAVIDQRRGAARDQLAA
jgi:hypothetical protein